MTTKNDKKTNKKQNKKTTNNTIAHDDDRSAEMYSLLSSVYHFWQRQNRRFLTFVKQVFTDGNITILGHIRAKSPRK